MTIRNFIRAVYRPPWPQLLQVVVEGAAYQFAVAHAGTEQRAFTPASRRQHTHDVYHLVLYTAGQNTFLLNGQSHMAQRGVLALASPGEPHAFPPCSPGSVEYAEVCFFFAGPQGNLTLPFHALLSSLTGAAIPPAQFPQQLSEQQSAHITGAVAILVAQLNESSALSRFAAARTMLDLLVLLIGEVFIRTPESPEHPSNATLQARELIERGYREQLRITDLADAVQLSPGQLCRVFRLEYGTSPIAYQRELRVQAAKNLLTSTTLPIKEIAYRIGFSDVYFFSKTFKQLVGVSPTEFRTPGGRTVR